MSDGSVCNLKQYDSPSGGTSVATASWTLMFLLLSGLLLLEFRFLFSPSDSLAWDTSTDADAASEGAVDIGVADWEPPWLASESSS